MKKILSSSVINSWRGSALALVLAVALAPLVTTSVATASTPIASEPAHTVTLAAGSGCATPVIVPRIDLPRSTTLEPAIALYLTGFSYPGSARYLWGDGQFGIAALGGSNNAVPEFTPRYAQAGTYTATIELTDSCGVMTSLKYTLSVPLVLPSTVDLTCPGAMGADNICVVPAGNPLVLRIRNSPAGASWDWSLAGVSDQHTATAEISTSTTPGEVLHIQAQARVAAGEILTPILTVVTQPHSSIHPLITSYFEPGSVTVGDTVSLSFALPTDGAGKPTILVDNVAVADSNSIAHRFNTVGEHLVAYQYDYADGTSVKSQVLIQVVPGFPILSLVGLAVALLGLVLLLAYWWRNRRRNLRLPDGSRQISMSSLITADTTRRSLPWHKHN